MHITECCGGEDPEQAKRAFSEMLGPQAVDQGLRQAISTCWMMLPAEKKNVATVEAEIRRLVDRALANLKEDASAFGLTGQQ